LYIDFYTIRMVFESSFQLCTFKVANLQKLWQFWQKCVDRTFVHGTLEMTAVLGASRKMCYLVSCRGWCSEHTSTQDGCRWSTGLGSPVVRALDLRLDGREFGFRPPRLILWWVTVFGRANHLGISPSHSASYPQWDRKWVPAKVRWCSVAGE